MTESYETAPRARERLCGMHNWEFTEPGMGKKALSNWHRLNDIV